MILPRRGGDDDRGAAGARTGSRHRLRRLDHCLHLVEDAMMRGRLRVDAPLARDLMAAFGDAGLVPGLRLEGRRLERVMEDIFALQERILSRRREIGSEAVAS